MKEEGRMDENDTRPLVERLRWIAPRSHHPLTINEAADALERLAPLADQERSDTACPCLYVEPCSPDCTCTHPASSVGCTRCCSYGSLEQRRETAKGLAGAADLLAEVETARGLQDAARGEAMTCLDCAAVDGGYCTQHEERIIGVRADEVFRQRGIETVTHAEGCAYRAGEACDCSVTAPGQNLQNARHYIELLRDADAANAEVERENDVLRSATNDAESLAQTYRRERDAAEARAQAAEARVARLVAPLRLALEWSTGSGKYEKSGGGTDELGEEVVPALEAALADVPNPPQVPADVAEYIRRPDVQASMKRASDDIAAGRVKSLDEVIAALAEAPADQAGGRDE